ncbi:MAG: acylphosphatase [Gammaproteobacteria bacterium]|nr:acylphosphatase [Gammaproteobacteria bacterium]
MTSAEHQLAMQGRIEGRVQGVAFRASMRAEAQRCGAAGWVRNLPDGAVEFLAQGDSRNVRQLLDWARRGPPGASVDGFNTFEVQPERNLTDFEIRG